MLRSQLNSYSGNDPIWGFVALVGSERFTGEAVVGIDPRVHLYSVDGRIYYAERDSDLPIGARLVNCGAITPAQLEYGAVAVGDVQSLARLFQRQPLVDRDAVELTIENATETLLESVATKAVGMPEVFPLRHHPAGIHHWLRSVAVTVPHVTREEAPDVAAASVAPVVADAIVPETEPAADAEPVIDVPVMEVAVAEPASYEPEPVVEPEPVYEPEPVAVEPEAAYEPEPAAPAPMLAPLSLQPLTPLGSQPPVVAAEPEPVEPEPVAVEPLEPEPVAVEPEPPAADPLMARLAPLPPNAVMTPEDAASIFVPTTDDLPDVDDLPPLSSVTYLPSSVAEMPPMPETPPMPSLGEQPASYTAPPFSPAPPPAPPTPDLSGAAPLPKLATAPYDVDAMMANLPIDTARPTGGQPHNMAAVEIWELVDHMLVDPGTATAPAGSDETPDDKRAGKGRLRGRKS